MAKKKTSLKDRQLRAARVARDWSSKPEQGKKSNPLKSRVLTGDWRVSDRGIFCGTLRVGKIDFDTNPTVEMRSKIYSQMEKALNL